MPLQWVISPWVVLPAGGQTYRAPLVGALRDFGLPLGMEDGEQITPTLRYVAYASDPRRDDVDHDEVVCLVSGRALSAIALEPRIRPLTDEFDELPPTFLARTPRELGWTAGRTADGEAVDRDRPVRDALNAVIARAAPEKLLR